MSPLVLSKAFACLVVICWSLWISLAERSHSSFALVVSYVQVRICFLLPAMSTRAVTGRSKPMRVGRHIGTLRLRVLMDDILF
jgi:acyl-coenzyme A thioesterase PaaI-like protein